MFFCLAMNAQHKFVLSGTIPVQYNEADILLKSENSAFEPISIKAKNGKFYFYGEIKRGYEPAFLYIQKDNIYLGRSFLFIGARDMKIDIVKLNKIDSQNDFRFFNVPFAEEQKRFDHMTNPIKDSAKIAFKPYDDARLGYSKGYNQDSLWTIVSDLRKKLLTQKIKFIESVPNDYISMYLFNREIINGYHPITAESLNVIYNKLNNSLKETDLGKSVNEYIKKKLSLTVGHVLPTFSFSTDKGQYFELVSLLNHKKLLLLCFWDSGCAPCIKKIPTLKMIDEKFGHKGLQLISVSLDRNTDTWFRSLERYKMSWLQTCDLPAYIKGNRIADVYDITHMPQYFLIDDTGRLVYHNEQSNDDDEFSILHKLLETQLPR